MKLCAIINSWADSIELLPHCIENLLPVVDGVIVVWSNASNYGNTDSACYLFSVGNHDKKVRFLQQEPNPGYDTHSNERLKRNAGIQKAKQLGFSHVLVMDQDEFYTHDDIESGKQAIESFNLNGLVCPLRVYIKKPTLWCEDHTLVPFIHKLNPDTEVGNFKYYPFTYDEHGNGHIDPTRRYNYRDGILFVGNITMHHFSWVRRNVDMKIENSSARNNIKKSSIYRDLEKAAPGVYNDFYRNELKESDNIFNLPIYE